MFCFNFYNFELPNQFFNPSLLYLYKKKQLGRLSYSKDAQKAILNKKYFNAIVLSSKMLNYYLKPDSNISKSSVQCSLICSIKFKNSNKSFLFILNVLNIN